MSDLVAALDEGLLVAGEDVELQRLTLGPGGVQIPFSVTCRATVRSYEPRELVGGIIQGDTRLVLSPTEIERAQWPGPGAVPASPGDRRVPRKGDRVVIQGRARTVEAATPVYVAGVLVRLELQVRG